MICTNMQIMPLFYRLYDLENMFTHIHNLNVQQKKSNIYYLTLRFNKDYMRCVYSNYNAIQWKRILHHEA